MPPLDRFRKCGDIAKLSGERKSQTAVARLEKRRYDRKKIKAANNQRLAKVIDTRRRGRSSVQGHRRKFRRPGRDSGVGGSRIPPGEITARPDAKDGYS